MSDETVIDRFERGVTIDVTPVSDHLAWMKAFSGIPARPMFASNFGLRSAEKRTVERHKLLKRAAKRKARKAAKHARRRNVK